MRHNSSEEYAASHPAASSPGDAHTYLSSDKEQAFPALKVGQ
jgi:hypothetical protein